MSEYRTNNVGQELVYHYTSVQVLSEILNHGKIWASDCRFLNDKQDFQKVLTTFFELFNESEKKILNNIFHFHTWLNHPFIFCCSKSPEVLSQWRGYADDGKGVAIGFVKTFLDKPKKSKFVECVYEDHSKFFSKTKAKFSNNLTRILDMYSDPNVEKDDFGIPNYESCLLNDIYTELLRVKNPSFREEQEVRLVKIESYQEIKTRVSDSLLIPYIEIDIYSNTVINKKEYLWVLMNEIWIGPKSNDRLESALTQTKQYGWGTSGIKKYNCGYA